MTEQIYDWSAPGGMPLIMTDEDVNRAVLWHAHHGYTGAEIYMNMAFRNPDRDPDQMYTLAQAAAMTASVIYVMGWGEAMDPHLAHIRPHNEEWMRFVAVLLEQSARLETTMANGGYGVD